MKIRSLGIASAASLAVLIPSLAFAHGHKPAHHQDKSHRVIHGTVTGGLAAIQSAATGLSITLTTSSGSTVKVTLTPTTRMTIEAKGTDAQLSATKAVVAVAAVVSNQNGVLTASSINAHLNQGDQKSGKNAGQSHKPSHKNHKSMGKH